MNGRASQEEPRGLRLSRTVLRASEGGTLSGNSTQFGTLSSVQAKRDDTVERRTRNLKRMRSIAVGSPVWARSSRLNVGYAEQSGSTVPLTIEIRRIVSAIVVASIGSGSLRCRLSRTALPGRCDRFRVGARTDERVATTWRWRKHS